MNGQQPTDEQALNLPTADSAPAASLENTDSLDLRRRRLLRGAAGIAPVVLTLRSGALAAASCTGVDKLDLTANSSSGNLSDSTVTAGRECIIGYTKCSTGTKIQDHTTYTDVGTVTDVSGNKRCIKSGTTYTGSSNIAILSTGALTSFVSS
jgi:hypothetical protein